MQKIIYIGITLLLAFQIQAQETVLFVLSSADTILLNNGEKERQTGVFLNEFYVAKSKVENAGYKIQIATSKGEVAAIDLESYADHYWKDYPALKEEAQSFVEKSDLFNHPISLEEAWERRSQFIGVVIPGGQGLMVDLQEEPLIPQFLQYFFTEKKPTGLICHAPSLLLTLTDKDNPYKGYKVNSVTPLEEFVIENFIMKGNPENRKIAKQLKKGGFKYVSKLPKSNFAIRDRNLITSQNPFSSQAFTSLYLQALQEYKNQILNQEKGSEMK